MRTASEVAFSRSLKWPSAQSCSQRTLALAPLRMGDPVLLTSGVSGVGCCHVKRVEPTHRRQTRDITAEHLKWEGCTNVLAHTFTADLQDKLYSTPTSPVILLRHLSTRHGRHIGGSKDDQSSHLAPTSRYLVGTCQRGPRCQAAEHSTCCGPGPCRLNRVSLYVRENKATTSTFK